MSANSPNSALTELLSEPRKTLDVEFKEWISPAEADHKVIVARAIIALANHGGGRLIIGFEEFEGSLQPAASRPDNLAGHKRRSNPSSLGMSNPRFSAG